MINFITAYTPDYQPFMDISEPILKSYCSKNNYKYNIYNIPKTYSRPYSWFKIEKLIEHTKTEYGYTLWADSDTAIVNYGYKIEKLINNPDMFLYLSKDMHNINCGVLMIKNNQYMTNFLQKIWEQTQFMHHVWWEQAAIIDFIEKNEMSISDHTEYVPQKILNAYDYSYYTIKNHDGQVDSSSFIVHTPGLHLETRLKILKKYAYKL